MLVQGGGAGKGVLKMSETLATKPAISQTHVVSHYQTSAFLGFCTAQTYHHLTQAKLLIPTSCPQLCGIPD